MNTPTEVRHIEKWETTDRANAVRRANLTIRFFFDEIEGSVGNLWQAEEDLHELQALVNELSQKLAYLKENA